MNTLFDEIFISMNKFYLKKRYFTVDYKVDIIWSKEIKFR